ncbi:MAG TPA: hypothetical protein VIL24_00030 [Clostridia bacterium]
MLKYSNTTRVTQQLSNEKNISSQIAVDYKEQITKDSSVAVFICGLASIFFCLLNYIAVPFMHLIGLGFGIFSVVKGAYAFKYKNVKAIIGFILGIIGIVLAIVAIIIGVIAGMYEAILKDQLKNQDLIHFLIH